MAELTQEGETAGSPSKGSQEGSRGRTSVPMPVVGGIPRHVLSRASGGRDLWSEPLSAHPEDPEGAIWDALREVLDPEIPISLVDLGLIYAVGFQQGTAHVRLTYTATACPCMEFIRTDIRERLLQEPWVDEVELEEVWDPPWTRERITERGREQLQELGVGA